MKIIFKSLKYLAVAIMLLVGITSCEDDNIMVVDNTTSPIALALDISTITLDGTNPGNPALTLTWKEASYSQPVQVNYIIEFDINQNFTHPVVVGSAISTNYLTWSVGELNNAISNAGVNPFEWTTVYARLKSSIGTQTGLQSISNVVSFNVYGYFNYDYIDLYMVGPACYSGWNNNSNNPPLFRSANNRTAYSYTGYFNAGQLKLIEVRGQWAPQYGESTQGTIAPRPTESVPDPSPIDDITSSGYYTFNVNLSNKTFSVTPYTATSAPATSVKLTGTSVSGSANSLVQLGGSSFDPHMWYIQTIHLVPGTVRFEVNGSQYWGSNTAFSGVATSGGANIPVIVEDNYEAWFNDLTGDYILIPLNL